MKRAASFVLLALLATGCRAPLGVSDGPIDETRVSPELKAVQPPLAFLGENALRVRVQPSFSDFLYAVDYAPQPKNCLTPHVSRDGDDDAKVQQRFCRDVLVTYHLVELPGEAGTAPPPQHWTFHLPVEEWRDLVERLDGAMDTWRDEGIRVADGTLTDVERVRDGRIRSIKNNFRVGGSPLNPVHLAQTETQRLLLLYGPNGKVPRVGNWTAHRTPDPQWACDNEDFVAPDPDGWGVGNDACAQRLNRK